MEGEVALLPASCLWTLQDWLIAYYAKDLIVLYAVQQVVLAVQRWQTSSHLSSSTFEDHGTSHRSTHPLAVLGADS